LRIEWGGRRRERSRKGGRACKHPLERRVPWYHNLLSRSDWSIAVKLHVFTLKESDPSLLLSYPSPWRASFTG
jgi:hypothetical protein